MMDTELLKEVERVKTGLSRKADNRKFKAIAAFVLCRCVEISIAMLALWKLDEAPKMAAALAVVLAAVNAFAQYRAYDVTWRLYRGASRELERARVIYISGDKTSEAREALRNAMLSVLERLEGSWSHLRTGKDPRRDGEGA